jgi:hypothetical protein
MDAPTSTFGNPTQFLDVEMDELARSGHLDAPDGDPRGPVEVVKAVELMAHQHPMHRRGWSSHNASDAGRAEAPVLAQGDDAAFDGRTGPIRGAVRTAGAILETDQAFVLVAAPPDVGPIPRNTHGRGRMGDRPAGLDALAEQESTSRGQASVTVHQKPPW